MHDIGSAHDEALRRAFDGQAARFEQAPVQTAAAALARLVRFAHLGSGSRILDAGCGPGLVAEAFLEAGHDVTGIDLSAEMVERAARRCARFAPRFRFAHGSLHALEAAVAPFDAAVSRYVLHHVLDPSAFVAAQVARLRPGGTLLLCDHTADPDPTRAGWHQAIERLRDETALFLHRSPSSLPETQRRMLEEIRVADDRLAGRKVLIVDDDLRNIFALSSVLERQQMKVLFAENGRDGIEVLQKGPDIEIVLMDIMMPEMDGYDTMRAIRGIPQFKSLPIITLTAKAMKGDRDKCLAAGASDYITKPVDVARLLSLMRVWLHR